MPFRSLTPDEKGLRWETYINPNNIIVVGKIVELAKRLDPNSSVEVTHMMEACRITLRSNMAVVGRMVKAYSKADHA